MKTYHGFIVGTECNVTVFDTMDSEPRHLDPRPVLYNHSPDGFAWGYQGSGPAQLALAILADHCANERAALEHYQAFKRAVIANLPQDQNWAMSGSVVSALLETIRQNPNL